MSDPPGLTPPPPPRPDQTDHPEAPPHVAEFTAGPTPAPITGRVLTAVGVVLALVAGLLVFLFTRGGSEGGADVALALDFQQGRSMAFRMSLALDGTVTVGSREQPLDERLTATAEYRVISIDASGVATIEVTVSDLSVTLNGQDLPSPGTVTSHMRLAPDGRILSGGASALGGAEAGSATIPGLDQFTPLLPDHEVGPGDEWDKAFTRPFPIGEGQISVKSHNSFLRYENVNGVRAAVIQSEMEIPFDITIDLRELLSLSGKSPSQAGIPGGLSPTLSESGTLTFDQTAWFDPKAGRQLKLDASGDMDLRFDVGGISGGVPGGSQIRGHLTLNLDPA